MASIGALSSRSSFRNMLLFAFAFLSVVSSVFLLVGGSIDEPQSAPHAQKQPGQNQQQEGSKEEEEDPEPVPRAQSRMKSLSAASPPECVIAIEEFVCTKDPISVRLSTDVRKSPSGRVAEVSFGVHQRVDGTDEEKAGTREVLARMDEYFLHEVLSKPEYDNVRSKCRNSYDLCAFWSAVGECESNRVFMLPNCAAACRFCLLLHTNIP